METLRIDLVFLKSMHRLVKKTINQSINQSITFICAQINIIRFQNTAQKNKAPGDGENDRPVFESTTTCHKSSSVKVCFEKVQLHK